MSTGLTGCSCYRLADAGAQGQGKQIGRRSPSSSGEQVGEAVPGGVVGPDVLGCWAVGLDEGGSRFADVTALGVCRAT